MRFQWNRSNGFLLAILANVLWGTSFLASKRVLMAWGPYTTSAARLALALLAMPLFCRAFGIPLMRPRGLKEWSAVAAVGLTSFAILYPLQFEGLRHLPSALSAAIMLTSPILLLVIKALVHAERPDGRRYAAVALSLFGALLLLFPGQSFAGLGPNLSSKWLFGALLTFGAAASLALSIVAVRRVPERIDSASLTFWSIALSLVVLIPFAWQEGSLPSVSFAQKGEAALWLLYLAAVCTAGCSLLWNRAVAVCSAKSLAPTMHLKTPVAVALGPLLARESISSLAIVGMLVVFVAIGFAQPQSES